MRPLEGSTAEDAQGVSPGRRLGRLWRLMPLLLLLVLIPFGWVIYDTAERGLRGQVESQLETVLQADVAALRLWMSDKETAAQLIAAQEAVREPAAELVEAAAQSEVAPESADSAAAGRRLAAAMDPLVRGTSAVGWAVLDGEGVVVASDDPALLGTRRPDEQAGFVDGVLGGATLISHPFFPAASGVEDGGESPAREPVMYVGSPLKTDGDRVFGVLALRLLPQEFTQVLTVARWGDSGETYAFDGEGRLLSRSRFEGQLREYGLIPDRPGVTSILTMRVVDPGYNVLRESPPGDLSPERPLTRMAASAVTGSAGVDAEGYRDYRGVPVVGAWTWLPDSGFGVATEVDVDEAYGSLAVVRFIVIVLLALVAVAALAVLLASRSLYFLRVRHARGEKQPDRLGRYHLEEKIGDGGLGEVYKASHVLLRRPTAVKILSPERLDDDELRRFQREVQLASRLTSPHTIRIYDYGIGRDGTFYYAMEYLPGVDLEHLVEATGPMPEGRVIHLLLQVCESLQEAHGQGVVHRDIKPGNVIVSPHGCELDFVVVTDFGLARQFSDDDLAEADEARVAAGTPRFLAPEALRHGGVTDESGDIYALGATAYYLLTGSEPFDADMVAAAVRSALSEEPRRPSERLGRPLSADLEAIVMQCLDKDPRARPHSVAVLAAALRSCGSSGAWSAADARIWWAERGRDVEVGRS